MKMWATLLISLFLLFNISMAGGYAIASGTCGDMSEHDEMMNKAPEEMGVECLGKSGNTMGVMLEEHAQSTSTPDEGVVFAVCIFAVAEDGTKVLVSHVEADKLTDCLKKKREAERDFRNPETRKKYTYSTSTRFTMTCDKVNAEIEIQADGSWKILKILGRHDEAYREK